MLFNLTYLNAKVIANIPEASGICFIQKSKTVVVVNDEGWIYELSKKGKLLYKKYLGQYDLEGVTYNSYKNELYLANESKNSVLVVDKSTFTIKREIEIKKKYKGKKVLKKSAKRSIEAIVFHNNELYLSHQDSVVFRLKLKKKNRSKIIQTYKHGYEDISGLAFRDGYLYMLSDKKNLLIKYDIEKNRTIQKIHLPSFAQEGVCFDNKKHIYFADDNGRVLRYKIKKLGIK